MSADQFFFRTPWAENGDTSAIPEATQPDGSLSFNQGWPIGYQIDPGSGGIDIPRLPMNELFFLVTQAIQVIQTQGFPNFIASADNDGSPFPYAAGATVRGPDGNNYASNVDANTDTPPSANWTLVSYVNPELPGVSKEYYGSTLPSGYVWANGTTIGSAASGATGRANADTLNLFTVLWNSVSNTVLPIQNSDGSAGTRGISAAADFAANKRLPTPDRREVVTAGVGNMGGTTDPGRMTLVGCGFSPTTLGASGGAETVSLTGNQNGTHAHTGTTAPAGDHNHFIANNTNATNEANLIDNTKYLNRTGGFGNNNNYDLCGDGTTAVSGLTNNTGTHTHTFTTGNSGLGSAHQNTQPTIMANFIIKL